MTIQQYLEHSGLSLRAFAAEVGVDPGTMSRWCAGHTQPSGGHLLRLLQASGNKISIEKVVGRKRGKAA